MLTDGLLQFSTNQDLTALTAATPAPSTNIIDLAQLSDLGGVDDLKLFAQFPVLPASATTDATISVSVQVSPDGTTFSTIEEFPDMALSSFTAGNYFPVRASLPFSLSTYRYIQLSYTVSAVLTAGTITAGFASTVPANRAYPRNFVA